jgi:flagellar biosynthesis/type III secretory pathway protein FliH
MEKNIVKLISFKKLVAVSALAIISVVGASAVSAQNRDRDRDRNDRRQEMNQQREERWRVRRSGRDYDLNRQQADILRQAVNQGYQQGFQEGRRARSERRRGTSYRNSNVYRSGDYGYESSVDRGLYQYYFQQGFQRGYQDGFSSRARYGRETNGTANILGNIVESILGLRRY